MAGGRSKGVEVIEARLKGLIKGVPDHPPLVEGSNPLRLQLAAPVGSTDVVNPPTQRVAVVADELPGHSGMAGGRSKGVEVIEASFESR
jgi:hypothetical protein